VFAACLRCPPSSRASFKPARAFSGAPLLLALAGFLLPGGGLWGTGELLAQRTPALEPSEDGFAFGLAFRGSFLPPPPGVPLGARPSGYGAGVQLFVGTGTRRFEEVELTWLEHGTGNRPEEFQGGRLRVVGVLFHEATGDQRGRLRTAVHTGGAWVQAGGPRFQRNSSQAETGDRPSTFAFAGGLSVGLELGVGFSVRLEPRLWVSASDEVWPNPSRLQPDIGVGLRWGR
jgi:hypothetical protein